MKTKEKFPLTTFIKNVQSTIKKVEKFALNNVENILVMLGIAAKAYEAYIADFNMPLSFYTDTALDMLIMWGWLKYLFANDKSYGAGRQPAPFKFLYQALLSKTEKLYCHYLLGLL